MKKFYAIGNIVLTATALMAHSSYQAVASHSNMDVLGEQDLPVSSSPLVAVKKEKIDDRTFTSYPVSADNTKVFTKTSLRRENLASKINPEKSDENCLACCVSFYNWVTTGKLNPANEYALRKDHNINFYGKEARLADPLATKKLETYQSITVICPQLGTYIDLSAKPSICLEALHLDSLEKTLNSLGLLRGDNGFYQTGILYFNWLDSSSNSNADIVEGHFVNFYISLLNGTRQTLIVDSQLREEPNKVVRTLKDFLRDVEKEIESTVYVWHDKSKRLVKNADSFEGDNSPSAPLKQQQPASIVKLELSETDHVPERNAILDDNRTKTDYLEVAGLSFPLFKPNLNHSVPESTKPAATVIEILDDEIVEPDEELYTPEKKVKTKKRQRQKPSSIEVAQPEKTSATKKPARLKAGKSIPAPRAEMSIVKH